MTADELKILARAWLRKKYPNAVIVFELSVGAWGSSSLDVAAITEDAIIGVEIKGAGDSPTRLKLQAASYSKAATYMWLLPCPELFARCQAHRPPGWGLLKLWNESLGLHEHYPHVHRLPTAPAQLVQALWVEELRALSRALEKHIPAWVIVKGRERIGDALAEHVPLYVLRPAVCAQLLRRNWRLKYEAARIDLPPPAVAP